MEEKSLAVLCDGLRLRGGAYVPDDPRGVIVLLHGIPSTAPDEPGDEGYPGLARRFAEDGWIAAWAGMRAAKESPGYFSIEGWVRDARSIVDAARALDGAAGLPLAILGSSAGGAVACEVVARGAPVDALVLFAAPAQWVSFAGVPAEGVRRIRDEAGMQLAPEVLEDPTGWADEFNSVTAEKAIVSINIPVLVVHGDADEVVPVDHARRIAERSRSAELRIIEGASHQLRRVDEAIETAGQWLGRML
ncbi:MAG: prolyl oligopeptidase family serine peptidase [Actinobacteria bacterium]|jgi:alpha-beta hydrolase superfamily lysophospholipase|nr:prolyl oligopeptidase family serine peptidase [Actinomycetota bacterium]